MMRPITWVIGLVLATGSLAGAEQASVLLIPLKSVGETSSAGWIAEGIAQNLLNELGRVGYATATVVKDQAAVSTPDDAVAAGKKAGAAYVLFGSFQLSETELRITAQVAKVENGKTIGAIRATGALRDLFGLEDSIADQLKRVLKAELSPPPAQPAQPAPPAPAIQPNGPLPNPQDQRDQELIDRARMRFDNPDYWYNRYNYGYPYYYGYYGYPSFYLPWYWKGLYRGPSPVPHGIGRDPKLGFGNSVGYYQMTLSPPKQ